MSFLNMLVVILFTFLFSFLVFYFFFLKSNDIPLNVESLAAKIVATIDAPTDEGEDCLDGETGKVRPERKASYISVCASMARVEFGGMKRTEANKMMVHKYIRDVMRDHGVRPSHIALLLPQAVEFAFVENAGEIIARQMRASDAVQTRSEVSSVGWTSRLRKIQHNLGFKSS